MENIGIDGSVSKDRPLVEQGRRPQDEATMSPVLQETHTVDLRAEDYKNQPRVDRSE